VAEDRTGEHDHGIVRETGWKEPMITFVPLDESHVSLMHSWLSAGETLRWYGRQLATEESIRQKYLITKPQTGTRCFIFQHDQEPIGYLQYYRISDYPTYCSLVGAGPHDYGLDLFIGRDDQIGRGVGTQIVTAALNELIFARDDAERCLVGPSPENKRAIRCYEKCCFRHVKTVVANDGEKEHIMVVEKPNKTRQPTS
jgi:RimJ/RimL family protein N-acetyltransferase